MLKRIPRVVIAGTSGDSGKTLISLGLLAELRKKGCDVLGFKKGPDYIDALWLTEAAGKMARNLDSYLMGFDKVRSSFMDNSVENGINVIEGNRGLFDGMNVTGDHSTAQLARCLNAPAILVADVTKCTRTAAAVVLGCREFDPDLNIAGVILNRVGGDRHREIVSSSIGYYTGIPVVGALPRIETDRIIPGRHLGLVTPQEQGGYRGIIDRAAELISGHLDIPMIEKIARSAPDLEAEEVDRDGYKVRDVRIGYFHDSAFVFYYPENLEALERAGADLVRISSMEDSNLPGIDALYIGGGFPETHAARLASNRNLMNEVKAAAMDGLPIYAECGGLIYLAEELETDSGTIPMAGILPVKVKMNRKPQGHGYTELRVDRPNPFFAEGTVIRGHEFHYTGIIGGIRDTGSVFEVARGTGCLEKRDGLIYNNVVAAYTHIHSLGTPEWADGMVDAAVKYKREKKEAVVTADSRQEFK
jgi:cobyrinic acid a,c-diamide synthase